MKLFTCYQTITIRSTLSMSLLFGFQASAVNHYNRISQVEGSVVKSLNNEVSKFEKTKRNAESGDRDAQYDLADMYLKGIVVDRDYEAAFKWFETSAKQDYEYAQEMMAIMFYSGYGVSQDYDKSKEWLDLLIAKNNKKAQNLLATMYTYGQGIEQDYLEAVKLFRLSANQGYEEAQFNLGLMYEKGRGVAKNNEEALYWYYESAKQEFPPAISKLELLNQSYKDQSSSIKSVETLALEGDSEAQNSLASTFKLSENNNAMSIFWYTKSAEQGFAEAQYNLGALYHMDDIQPHDYSKAKYWYSKACENGYKKACKQLLKLKIR